MKARVIDVEQWNYKVHLLWPVEGPEFQAYARRVCKIDLEDLGTFAGATYGGDHHSIIGLRTPWRGTLKQQGVLAHELMHVTYYLLRSRDVLLGAKTDEVFAYTLEYLFVKCMRALGRRKAK